VETPVVSVVAGGYSVREIDLAKIPGYVIAVNDAALHLPRWDALVSMDRLWTENRMRWILDKAGDRPVYLRMKTVPEGLLSRPSTYIYQCNNSIVHFGPSTAHMNGTNSGYVALNLAYILWPRELNLFGFDMCRGPNNEAHWYPDYPWNTRSSSNGKLGEWSRQFDVIAEQFARKKIAVNNVSSRSRIKQFKIVRPSEMGVAA
jgi:hypothetical protein